MQYSLVAKRITRNVGGFGIKSFVKNMGLKKLYHFVTHVYCSLSFLHVSRGTNCTNKNKSVYNLDMKIQGIAYGLKQIGIYNFKAAFEEL